MLVAEGSIVLGLYSSAKDDVGFWGVTQTTL